MKNLLNKNLDCVFVPVMKSIVVFVRKANTSGDNYCWAISDECGSLYLVENVQFMTVWGHSLQLGI